MAYYSCCQSICGRNYCVREHPRRPSVQNLPLQFSEVFKHLGLRHPALVAKTLHFCYLSHQCVTIYCRNPGNRWGIRDEIYGYHGKRTWLKAWSMQIVCGHPGRDLCSSWSPESKCVQPQFTEVIFWISVGAFVCVCCCAGTPGSVQGSPLALFWLFTPVWQNLESSPGWLCARQSPTSLSCLSQLQPDFLLHQDT